jgi:hypothetical protein
VRIISDREDAIFYEHSIVELKKCMTIHTPIESSSRVGKKYFVFENVIIDFWPKEA